MKELLEQTTAAMDKTWDMWQQMFVKAPWWEAPKTMSLKSWSDWFSSMRTTYEMNAGLWKSFVDQGEENFFRLFKQSPFWNESIEGQMREAWAGLRKAQDSQIEVLRAQWQRLEDLSKDMG